MVNLMSLDPRSTDTGVCARAPSKGKTASVAASATATHRGDARMFAFPPIRLPSICRILKC